MDTFANIKVGDKLMVGQSYGWNRSVDYYRILKCESVTEKQFVCAGAKFRKSDGKRIGSDGSIMAFDNELFDKGKKFLRRKNVENFKYITLTDEQCERIHEIIMEQVK